MAKLKKVALAVPQSRQEFEALAEQLGATIRRIERVESRLADDISALKVKAKAETDADGRAVKAMWSALAGYAEAHRTELLPEGRKSVTIAAGTIGWRLGNPRVMLDRPEEDVIADLEAAGLDQLLRDTVELDKQAILADPEALADIDGIFVSQAENLFFAPLEVKAEQTKTVSTVPLCRRVA